MTDSLQQRVVAFADRHDLHGTPTHRVLDLAAEVGEVAADATKSTGYGANPDRLEIHEGEIGDVLFALILVADAVGVDVEDALETALTKYERRLEETDRAGSGA